jgi:hypothetical protein
LRGLLTRQRHRKGRYAGRGQGQCHGLALDCGSVGMMRMGGRSGSGPGMGMAPRRATGTALLACFSA